MSPANLDKMNPEQASFYLRYLIARIASIRNVWNKDTFLIKGNEFYLHYYGNCQQAKARLYLPKDVKFRLEVIDAWNMTITPVEGEFSGLTEIPLPGKPYIAVRAARMK